MIPVTYGYAQVSKTDDATRNLETQLHILREYGIRGGAHLRRRDYRQIYVPARLERDDVPVRFSDTVVAWLDRFSPNFDEGVRIQAELTKQNVSIVAIKEDINTAGDSAATKFFRRIMMANGAY